MASDSVLAKESRRDPVGGDSSEQTLTTVSGRQIPLTVRLALRFGFIRARFLQRTVFPRDPSVPKDAREETITATAVLRTETDAATVVLSERMQRRAINNVNA